MVEEGIVKEVRSGKIIVNVERRAACGSCKACGMTETSAMEIEFANTIGAKVGDKVRLDINDAVFWKGVILFYGAPLAALMFGIWAGREIWAAEIASAIAGISAMALVFFLVSKGSKKGTDKYKPKITKA